jgi:DNA-binding CsgD family transcriptional regulator/DNA-binding MarR family transcriptional regulator
MNRETFDKIYHDELTPRQKKVLSLFLEGVTDKDIAFQIGASDRSTATHHIRNICDRFGFSRKNEFDYRERLVALFAKYKPELVSIKLLEKYGEIPYKPQLPEKPEPIDSPFYIERPPVEIECLAAFEEPGALIHIKAPKQMGKTSLILRIIERAKQKKVRTAYLNFSQIEASKLEREVNFLRTFLAYTIQALNQTFSLEEWDRDTPVMLSCTINFQELLKELNGTLILILDEVDRLFEYPQIYQNFFPMLRNWYEKASESETWEKLRLVVAHSTEDYGQLDINQSPFNVGYPIVLEEFTLEQIQTLASRHGLDRQAVDPLISMVGGHPYLLRLAFYHLYYQKITLETLLQEVTTEASIYKQHLFRILRILQQNHELKSVFKQIISSINPIELKQKTRQIYQLESMGLIKLEGNKARSRCRLYQLYFCDRL